MVSKLKCFTIVVITSFIMMTGAAFADEQLTFGTASPTGGWMMLASTVSKIINEKDMGYNITPVPSPRGSVENIETIVEGEREFGLTMANVALMAQKGTGLFDKPVTGINGWFAAHHGYWYVLARTGENINSISDLKGKRVAIGNPGDGDEALNKEIFEHLGLKWESINHAYSGFSGARDLIRQNQVDAIAYVAAPRLPSLNELLVSKELKFIEIEDKDIEDLTRALPYIVVRKMPQSDFPTLKLGRPTVNVVSINHIVICSAKLPQEAMYQFTKSVFDNIGAIQEVRKSFEVVTPENAVKGMPIPFHPGALQYYREAGLIK
jgi:TRAP transporter TAXI family solute receptor